MRTKSKKTAVDKESVLYNKFRNEISSNNLEKLITFLIIILISIIVLVIIILIPRMSRDTTEVIYKEANESNRLLPNNDEGNIIIKELLVEDIKDLYELALKEGFNGTKEEFYELLVSQNVPVNEIIDALQTAERNNEELKKALLAIGIDITGLANKNAELEILLSQLTLDAIDTANFNREEILDLLSQLGFDISDLMEKSKNELEVLMMQVELNSIKLANKNREEIEEALIEIGADAAELAHKSRAELEYLILQWGFDMTSLTNLRQDELRDMLLNLGFDITEINNKSTEELQYMLTQFELNTVKIANQNKADLEKALAAFSKDTSEQAKKNREMIEDALAILQTKIGGDVIDLASFVKNNLGDLSDDISKWIASVNISASKQFSDLNNYLTGTFSYQQNNVDNQFSNLTNNLSNLTAYIDNSFADQGSDLGSINDKLDLLFQSVSSGKTALATSLLTDQAVAERTNILSGFGITQGNAPNVTFTNYAKAIIESNLIVRNGKADIINALSANSNIIFGNVANDAAFNQIQAAINDIKCSNPDCGTHPDIIYIRHYHISAGNVPTNSDAVSFNIGDNLPLNALNATQNTSQGGCFQNPIYHSHVGGTQVSGGCYTLPEIHSHNNACYNGYNCRTEMWNLVLNTREGWGNDWKCRHFTRHDGCGSVVALDDHGYGQYEAAVAHCGGSNDTLRIGSHFVRTAQICSLPQGTYFAINCGKDENDIDFREINCNRTWGQIVEATIRY